MLAHDASASMKIQDGSQPSGRTEGQRGGAAPHAAADARQLLHRPAVRAGRGGREGQDPQRRALPVEMKLHETS